ncbi:hypothetical protein, partial [Burkholderia ubonensis]|uniref:hypothetical protein n=1 Tax=Burkholderia ubonensis TaxID=101571 RepID=UPI001E341EF1
VRAIDSVRSGDEIELSQRNFYLNSIALKCGQSWPAARGAPEGRHDMTIREDSYKTKGLE